MQQSAFDTYRAEMPDGSIVERRVRAGATDYEVRSAFAAALREAGFRTPALAEVVRPQASAFDNFSEARAYRPDLGERAGDLIYDTARGLGADMLYADRLRSDAVNLPGIGDVLTGLGGLAEVGRGNYATGAGLLGIAALGAVPGAGDAAVAGLRRGSQVIRGRTTAPIRAYHGSPHDFDRFDINRIGTGEGAQAYGHGLYFAENEEVARSYRDILGYRHTNGAPPVDWDDPRALAGHQVAMHGGDTAAAIERLQASREAFQREASLFRGKPVAANSRRNADAAGRAIESIRAGDFSAPPNPGHMYEVNINADPDSLLDWDRPLSGQSEQVRGALSDLDIPERIWDRQRAGFAEPTGASIYNRFGAPFHFRDRGVSGIQYLDQGSRTAGEGTRNYVIFDDSLIDIARKYAIPGTIGAGAAYGATSGAPAEAGPPPVQIQRR